jgi:16S rRNA (adenine1518-N6/adenine1519-N6)-dimethyltransferase
MSHEFQNHRARKRFGQNFLQDPVVIQRIINTINPLPGQHLVEIGPGRGAITLPLLDITKSLDVIELDRDLIPLLREKATAHGELQIFEADALEFDFCQLAAQPGKEKEKLRLIGNLPYNISTPLLFHLLTRLSCIQDMHFMFQKEVVDRMAASPGTRDYGRLSIMIQYNCSVEPVFDIEKEAFSPPPKIRSSFVRLVPHTTPPITVHDKTTFAKVVKQAFAQRRKTLRNNFRNLLSVEQIQKAGIDPGTRPEQLSLEEYATLSNLVSESGKTTSGDQLT